MKLRARDDKRLAYEAKRRAISKAVHQFEEDKGRLKKEKHELKVNETKAKFAGVRCRGAGRVADRRPGAWDGTVFRRDPPAPPTG